MAAYRAALNLELFYFPSSRKSPHIILYKIIKILNLVSSSNNQVCTQDSESNNLKSHRKRIIFA